MDQPTAQTAATAEELRVRFTHAGYHVFSVKARGVSPLSRRKVKLEQFLIFNQQFLTLIRAGLPILGSVEMLAKNQKNTSFAAQLKDVAARVKTGESLSAAFEAQAGVNVSRETRPVSAVGRIRTEKPDVVILDVKMPDLDGFGVLSLLRGEGNTVPVVMCSGSALQKDVNRAYAGGCSGYVEKPVTLEGYRSMAGAIVEYWRRGELPAH